LRARLTDDLADIAKPDLSVNATAKFAAAMLMPVALAKRGQGIGQPQRFASCNIPFDTTTA
jgi:hypothetical protein